MWFHESCRVFQDRLINDEDRGWFKSLLTLKMKNDFDLEYGDVITKETIIFGDFIVPNADPKIYAEIDDFKMVKFSYAFFFVNTELFLTVTVSC